MKEQKLYAAMDKKTCQFLSNEGQLDSINRAKLWSTKFGAVCGANVAHSLGDWAIWEVKVVGIGPVEVEGLVPHTED